MNKKIVLLLCISYNMHSMEETKPTTANPKPKWFDLKQTLKQTGRTSSLNQIVQDLASGQQQRGNQSPILSPRNPKNNIKYNVGKITQSSEYIPPQEWFTLFDVTQGYWPDSHTLQVITCLGENNKENYIKNISKTECFLKKNNNLVFNLVALEQLIAQRLEFASENILNFDELSSTHPHLAPLIGLAQLDCNQKQQEQTVPIFDQHQLLIESIFDHAEKKLAELNQKNTEQEKVLSTMFSKKQTCLIGMGCVTVTFCAQLLFNYIFK
ncbi:MAG: hypothetical protein AB7R69_06260 [Candidatus Babeliales bacterium]